MFVCVFFSSFFFLSFFLSFFVSLSGLSRGPFQAMPECQCQPKAPTGKKAFASTPRSGCGGVDADVKNNGASATTKWLKLLLAKRFVLMHSCCGSSPLGQAKPKMNSDQEGGWLRAIAAGRPFCGRGRVCHDFRGHVVKGAKCVRCVLNVRPQRSRCSYGRTPSPSPGLCSPSAKLDVEPRRRS